MYRMTAICSLSGDIQSLCVRYVGSANDQAGQLKPVNSTQRIDHLIGEEIDEFGCKYQRFLTSEPVLCLNIGLFFCVLMSAIYMKTITDLNRTGDDGPMSEVGTFTAQLAAFQPDDRNANIGTERGWRMLEGSLLQHGAGRAILVDKHRRIIAGNHVAKVAAKIGLNDCIVVPTDGRKLVVVQRTDLDLDSPAARALAISDNRTSEVGLSWDPGVLAELAADDAVDISALFTAVELADLLRDATPVPKFQPTGAQHRLDELQAHCRTCTCRKGTK